MRKPGRHQPLLRGALNAAFAGALAGLLLAAAGCDQLRDWRAARQRASQHPANQPATPAVPSATSNVSVSPQDVMATVKQAPISTTDMALAVEELKRLVQAVYQQEWRPLPVKDDNPETFDLSDVMENLVEAELKAQDLRARGLDQAREVRQRLAYVQRGFYAQEWDRWQRERAAPTTEEIHAFYEQNKAGFVEPERIRARQIVCETASDAEAVRAQAVQGAPFAQLAGERSVGAGKAQGGDIGWHLRAMDKERLSHRVGGVSEAAFFPQLEPVAFALETGQVSQPVKGPDERYYLVQLEERQAARQQTEVEVHDAIQALLAVQKLQQAVEELRRQARIERFPERLDRVTQ